MLGSRWVIEGVQRSKQLFRDLLVNSILRGVEADILVKPEFFRHFVI